MFLNGMAMTIEERGEIRDMIHGILSGWHAETVAREEVTNVHLKNIEDHFRRLNGSVAKHEKTINENLPHSVVHCPQAIKIKELEDNMITSKVVKKTLYIGFGIVCTLIAALWGVMEMIK